MIYPLKFVRFDSCFSWGASRSIECYDSNNNPINYSILIDKYINNKEEALKKIEFKNLSYMKCKNCKTIFNIDWSKFDRFPIPIYKNMYMNIFNYKYNKPGD